MRLMRRLHCSFVGRLWDPGQHTRKTSEKEWEKKSEMGISGEYTEVLDLAVLLVLSL